MFKCFVVCLQVVAEEPVEFHFHLYAPYIKEIKILTEGFIYPKDKRTKRIRRSKVYYVREWPPQPITGRED